MFGAMRIRRGPSEGDSGYRLPPALARLPADRGRLRREFVEREQRDRILLAALTVFGTKGFADATVKELLEEAGVARATYYKFFPDKESCLLGLADEVLGWLGEEVRATARGAADWPAAVVAVSRLLVELLRDDPRLARVCGIELLLGGPRVRARREAALEELAAGLRRGRVERPWGESLPLSLEAILAQGAAALTASRIAYGPDPSGDDLADELPEIVLISYLGAEDARRAVRSSRPRR
jgi:AcrR family transcriptional regulator